MYLCNCEIKFVCSQNVDFVSTEAKFQLKMQRKVLG